MSWENWEPWEQMYKKWVERVGEAKINIKYPALKGLWQWLVRETESRSIDIQIIDVEALLDYTLTISENKQILLEEMKAPLTEKEYDTMYQEQKGLLEKEAEEKYPEIITPLKERMIELEREADKKKRYQKLVKSLRWELAETVKRLEQERAKPVDVKPVKLRVLRDFKEGIIAYKSGQMVETRDLEWALQKIDAGFAERFKPEVAVPSVPPPVLVPTPPRELSADEKRRLEDEFQVTLIRELGHVPKNSMAEFRLELDTVKTQPFEKAREIIMGLTKEITGREYAKAAVEKVIPRERIVRLGVPEEERPPTEVPPEFLAYPAELPTKPKSELPFPRSPTSEERRELWDWFNYEMSKIGRDPYRYRKVFEERLNIPYRTWEGLLKTLQETIKDIAAGREFALTPLLRMPMPWEEKKGTEKWRRDAIVHFTSTKLYKTMDELIDKLSEWGVFPAATPEEIKQAVKEAWKLKDIWFTSVPKDFVEELIGEPVE